MVPDGAAVLTAGVDIQDDRLEIRVDAWGIEYESWQLEYHVLYGDPSSAVLWKDLDELILLPRRHARGAEMFIRATGIDTGGHHVQAASNFCRPRFRRMMTNGQRLFVFALKGAYGAKRPIWPQRATKNNVGKVNLHIVGVDAAKEAIYSRLRIERPGPGYFHFPKERGSEWFEQHTAEEKGVAYAKGFPYAVWKLKKLGARNEVLDTAVYSLAAFEGLQFYGLKIERELEKLDDLPRFTTASAPVSDVPHVEPPPLSSRPADPRRPGGWLGSNRDWLRR